MVVSAPPKSAVTAYAEDVIAGRIVAGRLVRLACERHLRDLETGKERGLHFDAEQAEHDIAFFALSKHSKGEWAGQPFILEPWEAFIVGCLFGWKRVDGTRRFRDAEVELARKNGKSSLAARIALKMAFFDNEPGAEVYAAATKREQAKIVWSEGSRAVKATPAFKRRITAFVGNLHIEATAQKFEPLGADADNMDGLNVHCAVVDELHAHKTRHMLDVLTTATGARRQPLIFVITTAGFDRNSVCWERHDYSVKVLEGILPDDTFFAYIAGIDEGDDWRDESVWSKANPNLGVSVKAEDLRVKCKRAQEVPGQQNAFRQLHLNEWTQQASRWLDMAVWDENGEPFDPTLLEGKECYAGLDLSSTKDITALALWFPAESRGLFYFWVPEEGIRQRADRDRVPYDVWVRQEYIEATAGNVVDYDIIRVRVNELRQLYNIREIAVDRWNSTQLQTQLMGDGFTVVPFGQGFASMTAPTKEMERLYLERKLGHGGNPVMRWMADNVTIARDSADNLKIDKAKSTERVDGMTAMAMAIGLAMLQPAETKSVYEERGILSI
ncbi:MAG: terminase large subunit [Anaerolineales bacterium]|nr:terminase large subunit [Anaerolineales bacterium]